MPTNRELLEERDEGHILGLTHQLLADVDHAFRLARAEQRLDLIGELRPRRLVPLRGPGPPDQEERVLFRLGERLEVRRRFPDRDSQLLHEALDVAAVTLRAQALRPP